jgi:hypothetical protein
MKNLRQDVWCVPAGIRVEHLPNASSERYRYANLLGIQFQWHQLSR